MQRQALESLRLHSTAGNERPKVTVKPETSGDLGEALIKAF